MQPSINFHLNQKSGVPAYQQIIQQVKHGLRLNFLDIGDQLPTVREVTSSIVINPNTVLKAYRQLENEGLVETRQGQGTFIVATLGNTDLDFTFFQSQLKEWICHVLQNGYTREDVEAVFYYSLQEALSEVSA